MAQAQPGEVKIQETLETEMKPINTSPSASAASSSGGGGGGSATFKFNAQAPEFVPRSIAQQVPVSGYFYPCFQFLGGSGGSDWFYVGDQESAYFISNSNGSVPDSPKNVLTDDLRQKIVKQVEYQFNDLSLLANEPLVKQACLDVTSSNPNVAFHALLKSFIHAPRVEYQFSDLSLLANESLVKQINKDPEGYVPIPVIASTKKIKSLVTNSLLITQALQSSSKLIISSDGKKVKRKYPFTEKDKEDLQSRTVVAENLPEDHSHQNLEKIFAVVGSVKSIRICHPQESNSSRSKSDYVISNKLHALVEYETTEVADRAVEKLNDERNWRKGLRVRLLLRRSPKSVLKTRKSDFDGLLDDEDYLESPEESSGQPNSAPPVMENNAEESLLGTKKGWGRGRGKGRGRTLSHGGRGLLTPSPSCAMQCEASPRLNAKGPRMPDGTRGFTMGRGKPLTSSPQA